MRCKFKTREGSVNTLRPQIFINSSNQDQGGSKSDRLHVSEDRLFAILELKVKDA